MGNTAVRRRRAGFAAGIASLAMALGFTAIPADAAPPPQLDYVALGDSYASGHGAVPYTDLKCFVSQKGYPAIADKLRGVQLTANAACSGWTMDLVLANLPVAALEEAEIVTLTVGANDLNSTSLLFACLPAPTSDECIAERKRVTDMLTDGSFATELVHLVTTIHAIAPDAKIVLTGYPLPLDPSHPLAAEVNSLAGALNAVIAGVANFTNAQFDDVQYVDVTGAFAGHGVGSADPWINFNPENLRDPANFHPTGEGYRHGYFASLVSQDAFVLR
ncbi:SGNH/GDSL hydrolase family protein [Arthrobacter sp. Cr_A7]|uniref:SGNH/GDSL hydrolase family protein n=1 Tax=Arthrobacter sp. Cr_A7 TaxID=3031017 RepID=UPI0023D9F130|nr:SGNH/GDSL hydrolase family protein [Arthrobacter sp. Cr_A7]MDF2051099.1 SGNH/GDSL hydrolase family protein [Arthrobacter sp. Cr_A7]